MPSKYTTRDFKPNNTYHVYNLGAEGKSVFLDQEDYNIFYYYLYIYVSPIDKALKRYKDIPYRLISKNLNSQLKLYSYTLLPDHFHLILHQKSSNAISQILKQLVNAYTGYYNKKYKRIGPLFSGRYKAVLLPKIDTVVQISRHIHLEPLITSLSSSTSYAWSSFNEYSDPSTRNMCETNIILEQFPSVYAYKKFTNDQKNYSKRLPDILSFIIEKI